MVSSTKNFKSKTTAKTMHLAIRAAIISENTAARINGKSTETTRSVLTCNGLINKALTKNLISFQINSFSMSTLQKYTADRLLSAQTVLA